MTSGPLPGLKPTLGLLDATAIGVGAIIGAGIFVVTGIAAARAGSAVVVSMLIAAAISLLTALSFAELTAWMPKEGSVYELARRLLSPFAGFVTGWMWIVSNTFAGAAVSLGFAYYVAALAPDVPARWLAAGVCLAFTALNHFGVRASAVLNNALVLAKLLVLVLFCLLGALYVRRANFTPFDPASLGVLSGASYIFFAYGGFARVAVLAEEVKDPERNVPRAILLSLAISTTFYVSVGLVAVGLVGASRLAASGSPLTEAIQVTGSRAAVSAVSAGGMLATASVLLTSVLGVSRVAYAMARSGDLPGVFGRLHPTHDMPSGSLWITGAVMAVLVVFVDLTKAVSTFALLPLCPFVFGGHRQLAPENLALRQQLAVYKRTVPGPRLRTTRPSSKEPSVSQLLPRVRLIRTSQPHLAGSRRFRGSPNDHLCARPSRPRRGGGYEVRLPGLSC
jgi:APA family basic amino acid/polyamine antiporter